MQKVGNNKKIAEQYFYDYFLLNRILEDADWDLKKALGFFNDFIDRDILTSEHFDMEN